MRSSILFILAGLWVLCKAQTVPYNLTPDWVSQPNGQYATGLGLADINGDGFKDLVIANGNDIKEQRLTVHYNSGSGDFNPNPDWHSADSAYHGHLACGDVDNDGDIDVVVSVYIGHNGFSSPGRLKVYYNQNGQLESIPSFISDPFYTFSCALGDADADGDLDIAAAAGEPYGGILDYGRIFINDNGAFNPQADWESEILMGSLDTEFGDFDRDGFLDVIFVCEGTPNMIYLANEQGIIDESPDWQSTETENYINSVEVGYAENGSMVVMTENNQLGGDGRVRKYDFGTIIPNSSGATWYSNSFGYGSGITLHDVDLDGHTDLIYGGWWLPVKIALGDGIGFELNPSYSSSTSSVVEAIQLADLDRVDVETTWETFTVESGQDNKNIIALDKPVVEEIDSIYRNGGWIGPESYKHLPGKPWITLSERMQAGEVIQVTYQFSDYPDMVVTNWDASKGDYIFYNTASSVGLTEPNHKDARQIGSLKIWPVPANRHVRIAISSPLPDRVSLKAVAGHSGTWILEIYNTSGQKILSSSWADDKEELTLNLESIPQGLYTALLKDHNMTVSRGRIVVIR